MPSPHSETTRSTTVAFRTVGCRLNQCETAQMQEALSSVGFRLVDWDNSADVRVVNTCTVTAKSDRTCRHEIHSARRRDPDCVLAVTGCLAQVAPEAVTALPEVDLVLGNPDKQGLAEYLATALAGRATGSPPERPTVSVSPYPEQPAFETESLAHFHGRTRAFLKVQTGCDSRCSYCVVPLARGPARSMPKADVLAQVRLLRSQGHREIVLTGIDLGSWGKDTGEGRLAGLLDALLSDDVEAGTSAVFAASPEAAASREGHSSRASGSPATASALGRLRLSSVEPLELDTRLIDVVENAGDRMARHFHLPLQSGSDSVLRRMRRPYSATRYLEITQGLARRLPDAAIGADVIVGFPGETEAEFADTLALVEASPLTYLHVFAYSDRPGTAAAAMEDKLPPGVLKERSQRLRRLGARKREAFRDRLAGSEQHVLVLDERAEDGRLVGLAGNYVEVLVEDDGSPPNRFVRARLERALPGGRCEVTLLQREEDT